MDDQIPGSPSGGPVLFGLPMITALIVGTLLGAGVAIVGRRTGRPLLKPHTWSTTTPGASAVEEQYGRWVDSSLGPMGGLDKIDCQTIWPLPTLGTVPPRWSINIYHPDRSIREGLLRQVQGAGLIGELVQRCEKGDRLAVTGYNPPVLEAAIHRWLSQSQRPPGIMNPYIEPALKPWLGGMGAPVGATVTLSDGTNVWWLTRRESSRPLHVVV